MLVVRRGKKNTRGTFEQDGEGDDESGRQSTNNDRISSNKNEDGNSGNSRQQQTAADRGMQAEDK